MAWSLISSGSTSAIITAGTGSQTVNLPGSPQAGDLCIIAIAGDISCQNSITTAGYTSPDNATGANPGAYFAYKILGSSETSVDVARDGTVLKSLVVQVWRGGNTGNILGAAYATATTGTSANADPPSVTTVGTNDLVVTVAYLDDDDSTVSTYPTNYTNGQSGNTGQSSTTVGSTVAIASRIIASPGTTADPDAFAFSSSDAWRSSTISFREAVGNLTKDVGVDALKLSESVTNIARDLSAVVGAESLKLDDTGQGMTALYGVVHVTESITNIQRTDVEGGDLSRDVGTEPLKLSESATTLLNPLVGTAGSDALKVTDSVTARLPVLIASVADEGAKVTDSVTAVLQLVASVSDSLKASDSGAAVLNPLIGAVANDGIKVTDSVSALLPVLVAAPADDGLKLGESDPVGSLVDLADLTAALPADGLILSESLSGLLDPLVTTVSDSLKLSENAAAERLEAGTLTASAQESLKIVDTGNGCTALYGVIHVTESAEAELETGDLDAQPTSDSLKISDSASAFLIGDLARELAEESVLVGETAPALAFDALAVSLSEQLIATDAEQFFDPAIFDPAIFDTEAHLLITALLDPLIALSTDTIVIADTVSAALDLLAASAVENLVVSDEAPTAQRLEPGELTASASESLKLQDTGNGRTALYGVIHVTESVDADMGLPAGELGTTAGPDSLKLSDGATAALSLLQATASTETLHLLDASDSWIELWDVSVVTIRISESAQAQVISAEDLSRDVGSDSLKLSETATARLNPLVASVSDALKIGETIAASFGLTATAQDSLKVSDSIAARLDPLQASATEAVKVSDAVTNAQLLDFGALTATPSAESLHVTEAPSVVLNPLRASTSDSLKVGEDFTADRIDAGELTVSRTELLHVTESATGTLAPLLASVLDAVTLSEQVIAGIELSADVSESLKVSDAVTQTSLVAVNTLTVDVAESLQIAEVLGVCLDPLVATVSESVIVTDEATAGTDLLQVVIIAEGVKISDSVDADANILVRPIDLMGTDVEYFDLRGTDARTMDYTVTLE